MTKDRKDTDPDETVQTGKRPEKKARKTGKV